jgi:hypothetical protein
VRDARTLFELLEARGARIAPPVVEAKAEKG